MNLTGKIIHGEGRGGCIGFPTLNIEGNFPGLEQGVYAVWVSLEQGRFRGAMNFGPQPTFGDSHVRVEVFLLDFDSDIYGETATVEVVQKIREIQKFASAEELKTQIMEDISRVKSVLGLSYKLV
ncbi:MAG: riboflavin kinase [Candidatus Gracilibacteria bacterium]